MVKTAHKRLRAVDWEEAALDVIAEGGVKALAVESLARRLGVTKGSFYWHFPSRQALIEAALKRWEDDDWAQWRQYLGERPDCRQRLCELFRHGSREYRSHALYHALCNSSEHEIVRPILTRVARRRLAFLSDAFAGLGMNATQARYRARLTYAAYAGFIQIAYLDRGTKVHGEDFSNYVEHTIDALIP